MHTEIYSLAASFLAALTFSFLIYPTLLKWSVRIGYTDKPGARKVHRLPVPLAGGPGIMLSLIVVSLCIPAIREYVTDQPDLPIALVIVSLTGMADDKLNLSPRMRFVLEIALAAVVANAGIRLHSLHGLFGIQAIPEWAQYTLTVLIITGITNAFNLIDGIDGLAGTLSIINMVVLGMFAILLKQYEWAYIPAAVAGSLSVFLKYNWRPAKVFMGDGGSLLLGFLMGATGIALLNTPLQLPHHTYHTTASMVAACFSIPVSDTLRVFVSRMRAGKSPFHADKTHLHHKLIRHFLTHSDATRRIIFLHLTIIVATAILQNYLSLAAIIVLQLSSVFIYTMVLDFIQNFSRWYRFIRRLENN